MYNIYILEDNVRFRNDVITFLGGYAQNNKRFMINELITPESHYETFAQEHLKSSSITNIYIIDIDLKASINGLDIAKEIRQKDYLGYIIFLTSHTDLKSSTFDLYLKAISFIDKQEDFRQKLTETLNQISIETREKPNHNTITFKHLGRLTCIHCDDILFVETSHIKRRLLIHTFSGHYEFSGTLKEILDKLPGYFVRCHKSYVLNPKHITEIDLSQALCTAYFKNSKTCAISKKYVKDTVQLLQLKELYNEKILS